MLPGTRKVPGGIGGLVACFGALVIAVAPRVWATGSAVTSAALSVSATRLAFYASDDGSTPTNQLFKTILVSNAEAHAINWAVPPSEPWIFVSPRQGSIEANQTISIAVGADLARAEPGGHSGSLTIWDADAREPVLTIDVFLRVCRGTCVSVDVAETGHTVSPLLFGSQLDWRNSGSYMWNKPVSATCAAAWLEGGTTRPGIVEQVRPLGLQLLRYPSGISADFYHWYQALGPVTSRVPQIDAISQSIAGVDTRQCPVFGPDEFASFAGQLGTEMLTVANVGTGTAQEAAVELAYYAQRGIAARYWEIGNEVYIPGIPIGDPSGVPYAFAAAYKFPDQYAAAFDDYARALRAVDPNVKVGAIADPDSSAWNDVAWGKIQERADFVATHLLYPPHSCTALMPNDQVYRLLLASPELMTFQLEKLKRAISQSAVDKNRSPDIAVTEYGAFFWCFDYGRNQTLASALFTAISFHVFLRDPRITIANLANLSDPMFQAPLTTTALGSDVRSALYDVFRLYAQTAGSTVTSTSVLGAPTFATEGLGGFFPPIGGLPVLDAVAVWAPDKRLLRLFVVNRSLSSDVTAHVALDAFPGSIASISTAIVNGASVDSANSLFDPYAVIMTSRGLPAARELDVTFPAHSLVVLAVQAAP